MTIRIPRRDFEALKEYSWSIPTGLTVGTTWRACTSEGWLFRECVRVDDGIATIASRRLVVLPADEEALLYGAMAPPRRRPRRIAKKFAQRSGRQSFKNKRVQPLPRWPPLVRAR
jgi:hypothetical protein